MYNKIISLLLLTILFSGCNNKKVDASKKHINNNLIKEHLVQSVLWQQNAAEYKALCYQAFNLARMQINEMVKNQNNTKPMAIITFG